MSGNNDDKPNRTIVAPGSDMEGMVKSALAMHKAIHGRDPTDEELDDMRKLVAEYEREGDRQ